MGLDPASICLPATKVTIATNSRDFYNDIVPLHGTLLLCGVDPQSINNVAYNPYR